jgi:phage gp29-like protein
MPNPITRAWNAMFRSREAPEIVVRSPLGPGAGLVLKPSKWSRQATHPMVGADAARVHNAILRRLQGYEDQYQDFLDDMRDRDPRVAAVCATRILALQGRPWSVAPPSWAEADTDAQRVAEDVTTILRRCRTADGKGWPSIIGELANGVVTGLAVLEIEWGVSPEGWHVPVRLHWRHSNRFGWDEDLDLVIDDPSVGGRPKLSTFGNDKFVVHSPSGGRAAYPMRRGVMLGMLWPSLLKRTDLKFWIKATERWGAPLPILELPENNAHLKDAAKEMLNDLTANWNAVLWGGVKASVMPGSGNLNPAVYESLANFCNVEIAIAGLGQNLTTEVQGGSYAAATAQNFVRMDLLAGDCAELDATIANQLIAPIVRYNWPGAILPEYTTETVQQAELEREDVDAGLFTPDDYRASKGYGPMSDGRGAEYRTPASQQPAGNPFIFNTIAPPGGADAAPPFTPTATTNGRALASTWATSARSAHERKREHFKSSVASASSRRKRV